MVNENPNWSDVMTAEELAAALDVHALKLAKRFGIYDIAQDMQLAAQALRELSEKQEATP